MARPFFDLASLAKPLVTAPLALALLDLDQDRREQLGFRDRKEPLTVRQLLSHSAGLPPWLPYTGEPLARQLARGFPAGAHPKLVRAAAGATIRPRPARRHFSCSSFLSDTRKIRSV